MALKNVVTLAALIGGGLALANLSKKGRGPLRATTGGSADDELGGGDASATAPLEAALDSPNPAERMQRDNLAGSPIGAGTPLQTIGAGDDLFGSDAQVGESARTPGLPDFSRGA